MSLEDIQRRNDALKGKVANISGSGDPNQVIHDANEKLIGQAELAAAYRTLGLSDDEGVALIAQQVKKLEKKDPVNAVQIAKSKLVSAASDLRSQGLGVIAETGYLDAERELSSQYDDSDRQVFSSDELDKGVDKRRTDKQKKAEEQLRAESADRRMRGSRTIIPGNGGVLKGEAYERVGQEAQETPLMVSARRDARAGGEDLVSLFTAGQSANRRDESSNKQLYDVWERLTTAMSQDSSLMTEANAQLVERIESQIFPSQQKQIEKEAAQLFRDRVNQNVNIEAVEDNNLSGMIEAARLRRDSKPFPRLGNLTTNTNLEGVYQTEIPATNRSFAIQGVDGAYYDMDNANMGVNIPTARPGDPVMPPTVGMRPLSALEQEMQDRLYPSSNSGRQQADINLDIGLFEERLRNKQGSGKGQWGTMQGAPTTVTGVNDLRQALMAVAATGKERGYTFKTMPEERGVDPVTVERPGPVETLKALGYNQPETTKLLNAVYQMQMATPDSGRSTSPIAWDAMQGTGAMPRQVEGGPEIYFDAPVDVKGGILPDTSTAPITSAKVNKAFAGLTGENMENTADKYEVLEMARKSLQGIEQGPDRKLRPAPIGGIKGNPNKRYNTTGITDPDDLTYALEQQALRRDRKITARPGRTPILTGEVKPRDRANITSALLATARAQRDASAPKALPPASDRAQRENAFLDQLLTRNEADGNAAERVRLSGGRSATSFQQTSQAPDPVTPQVQQQVASRSQGYTDDPGALVKQYANDRRSSSDRKRSRRAGIGDFVKRFGREIAIGGGLFGSGVVGGEIYDNVQNEQEVYQ